MFARGIDNTVMLAAVNRALDEAEKPPAFQEDLENQIFNIANSGSLDLVKFQ